eukprot:123113-Hanusia_phi.AAC.4
MLRCFGLALLVADVRGSQEPALCDDVGAAEAIRSLKSFDVHESVRLLEEKSLGVACDDRWVEEVEEVLGRILSRLPPDSG